MREPVKTVASVFLAGLVATLVTIMAVGLFRYLGPQAVGEAILDPLYIPAIAVLVWHALDEKEHDWDWLWYLLIGMNALRHLLMPLVARRGLSDQACAGLLAIAVGGAAPFVLRKLDKGNSRSPLGADQSTDKYTVRHLLDSIKSNGGPEGLDLTKSDLSGLDLSPSGLKTEVERSGEGDSSATPCWLCSSGGINLREADLHGACLAGANLREADLTGANLKEANLKDINLLAATLYDVNLDSGDLQRARLTATEAWGGSFEGAMLNSAELQFCQLIDANLEQADLQGANLEHANLSSSSLLGANLKGANLARAILHGAPTEYGLWPTRFRCEELAEAESLAGATLPPNTRLSEENWRVELEKWREEREERLAKYR